MIQAFLLILGFILLLTGADWLVDGSSSLARRWQISELVIGLTIVAFGTSAPELVVNVAASLKHNNAIALGNILGSNILNILLILGVSAIIYPLEVTINTVWKEIPLSLLSALLVLVLANDRIIDKANFSAITRIDGMVLLSFFIIFVYYTLSIAKESRSQPGYKIKEIFSTKKSCGFILAGLVLLIAGGKIVVISAISIAARLGLSESLIGLTIVAGGTSLPELATSSVAAYKKHADIAVGNVIGSNIFNIFFVLGISATIYPIQYNSSNNIDTIVTVLASLALFLFMFSGGRKMLDRWEGCILIFSYIVYLVFIITRG